MPRPLLHTAASALALLAGVAPAAQPQAALPDAWEPLLVDEFDAPQLDPARWSVLSEAEPFLLASPAAATAGGALQLTAAGGDNPAGAALAAAVPIGPAYLEISLAPPSHPGFALAAELVGSDADAPWTLFAPEIWRAAPGAHARLRAFAWPAPSQPPIPGVAGTLAPIPDSGFRDFALWRMESGRLVWSIDGVETAIAERGEIAPLAGDGVLRLRLASTGYAGPSAAAATASVAHVRVSARSSLPVAEDRFADPAGSVHGAGGGHGWASAWRVLSGEASIVHDAGSLTGDGVQAPPAGGRLVLADAVVERDLQTPLPLHDLNDLFAGCLVRLSPGAGVRIELTRDDALPRWTFGLAPDRRPFAGVVSTTAGDPLPDAGPEPLALASMLVVRRSAEPDTALVHAFAPADPLPPSALDVPAWLAANNGASSVVLSRIRIVATGTVELDDLRIGASLAAAIDPPAPLCPADVNRDGSATVNDLLVFLTLFRGADPAADMDASGTVGVADLLAFLTAFRTGC